MAKDETPKYDPEIEKEAIAAEESYKQKNGQYRESSAYNKAQEEEAARKAAKEKRRQDAWRGVRRDLNGNEIGDYSMRQDNTRMKDMGPDETLDLTDEQKKDLEATTDWELYHDNHNSGRIDHKRIVHGDKAPYHHTYETNTSDVTKTYKNPKTGEFRDVKQYEEAVHARKESMSGIGARAERPDWWEKSGTYNSSNGKTLNPKDGTMWTNYFKNSMEPDPKDKVKTTPRK